MSDNAAMLEAAKGALRQLHRGNPLQIKEAEAALNHLSGSLNPQAALALADRLLHPQPHTSATPAETMHAFHLLEQRVLPPFTELPETFRLHVRQFALRLVAPNPLYSSLHTNKAVSFLAALAVREWPQRYHNFISDVIAMPAHIGCRILTHISDDIHAFHSSIHQKRLQELRHAMALTLSTTLPFITSAADNFHNTANFHALLSAVQCIRSFLPWASLSALFSMRVPHACFMLVSNPRSAVRNEVLNALFDFVGRTFPSTIDAEDDVNPNTAFREVFLGLLNVVVQTPLLLAPLSRSLVPPTDAFPPLKEAWFKSQPLNSIDDEAHEFIIKFFEVLSKLGSTHFARSFLGCNSDSNHMSNTDRELGAAFVDLMATALSCPSYVLRETVYNFFTSMTGHISKKQLRCELASFLATRFLYAASAAVLKFSCHPDVELYKEVDYAGDDVSFRVARRKINGLMYGALRGLSQILPEMSALFILSRLIRLISQPTPCARYINTTGPREVGVICPDSTSQGWNFGNFVRDKRAWRHCIDAMCPALDSICQVASEKVSMDVRTQMTALQRQAFEFIIGWNELDMLVPKIHVLRALFLLYSTDPSKLDACIETIGGLIDNPKTPSSIRSRACVSLRVVYQRFCRSKDAHIGRFANLLCEYAVNSLLNPKFRDQDKFQLMQASISYVMSIPDIGEAEQRIERMLMPLVDTLSSAKALSVHQSPNTFLEFLIKGVEDDVSPILCAFEVLAGSMHQVSRPMARRSRTSISTGILSHAIAPKAVQIASVMLSTLHGFFNPAKFRPVHDDKLRRNVLLPTCKHLVHVVKLDNPDVLKRVADEHDSYEEKQKAFREGPTVQEERCYDILCTYGIDPPDSRFAWIRETLYSLRTTGYEIVRACILSGVTKSSKHLTVILGALCTDFEYVETDHLLRLISRVLSPLFSFSVVSTDPSFLEQVAKSDVPKLLLRTRELIDASIKGAQMSSDSSVLDISRDFGRLWLHRAAINLITGMYPPVREKTDSSNAQVAEYFPPQFQVPVLGDALAALWITACSPGHDTDDKSSFRYAFDTVSLAADVAPRPSFQFFGQFLEVAFGAAVLTVGESSTSVDAPVGAMVSIIRKWPAESGRQLYAILRQNEVLQGWVSECIQEIATTDQLSKPKKHKQLLRDLVNRIADHEGTVNRKETKVKVLPEKLMAINTKRRAKREQGDLDELELGDGALNSLFGEGDPL
eukprot:TRINITY_DN4216_c0_g1_i1.p1 TRINITY_DN4216_c0_g1~~TRINITY_DN4216_c0_g1_i1.p1  ORF type:complete len:1248 (+),score=173.85 TRINITY_DN4216_c0_g1_i1:87-3746(+)